MAVELATAYVTLTVSAKGIAADIERQVVPAAGAAGSKAGGAIASGMKTALAGVAVVGFLKGAFSEMEEAQKVGAQTAAVIASTGGAANVSAEGFENLAGSISKVTGMDDELVQSSANLLATFTQIQNVGPDKVFDRATQAAVDLGAAMKMGPEAAAMQLGKALNDPVAGVNKLARAGVQLSVAQKQQVADFAAVGDMVAAQGVILGEVERQVGGSAAAQATSADHMRVAFGNLQESVGNGLAPALSGLARVGTTVFDSFSGLPEPVQQGIIAASAGAAIWHRYKDSLSLAGAKLKGFIADQYASASASIQQASAAEALVASTLGQAATPATQAGGVADALLAGRAADAQKLSAAMAGGTFAETANMSAVAANTATNEAANAVMVQRRGTAQALGRAMAAEALVEVDSAAATTTAATAQGKGAAASSALSAALGPLAMGMAAVTTAAIVGEQIVSKIADSMDRWKGTTEGLAIELALLGQTDATPTDLASAYGSDLSGLADEIANTESGWNKFAESLSINPFSKLNPFLAQAQGELRGAKSNVSELDAALAQNQGMGRAEEAAKAYEFVLARLGRTAAEGEDIFPQYAAAVRESAAAAELAAGPTDDYAAAVQAAHQANKDALLGTAARIAKDAEFRASLNQVKDSIEAYAENERNAAGTGAEASRIRADSARNQVANAKAVEQAERALVDSGKAVAQAQRGVADAYRAREAAVRGIAQAEQGVLDAERGREAAVRNLATANATLEASQRQSVQLARDLSGAFDAARESLDDLNRSAAGDKLSVKSAEFALADARLAAGQGPDDPGAPNAQAKLNLAVAQAELALAEARDRASESAENLNERTAAGLDQSPEVLAAQEAVATNATTIATNQQAVADAQVGLEASDRTLAEAHFRVAEAHQAVRAADQAIVDAKDQVIGAKQAQQTAAEDLATAEKIAADEIIIADFLVWLSKDAAQKKSTELKDQVVTDMGLMFTAAETFGLGLAGVNAWLTTLTQGLDPTSPLRQNIDSLLAQLTPIAIPAAPSGGAGSGIGLGAGASGSLNGGGQPIYGPTGGIVGYRPASVSVRSGDGKSVTVQGDLVINAEKADADQLAERFAARVLDRVR